MKRLNDSGDKIILGDFNFHDREEESIVAESDYTDLWSALRPNQRGGNREPFLRLTKIGTWGPKRLDRIVSILNHFTPKSIEIVGKEPAFVMNEGRKVRAPISDHWGLVATFRCAM
jgi:hypothetical protein